MAYELPPLPYEYEALEPHIDAETMRLHHDKHHATYVTNLNNALAKYPDLPELGLEDLVCKLDTFPEDIRSAVRNNGGGHLNHTMFWEIMSPQGGGAPTGLLARRIDEAFGSFDAFKQQFNAAGLARFGSGWVWLVMDAQTNLKIVSTPNQDNPMMEDSSLYPVLGNDVWEHAYYLKHQNKRADYLNAWWNVVDWVQVGSRFEVCDYVRDEQEHTQPADDEIATPS